MFAPALVDTTLHLGGAIPALIKPHPKLSDESFDPLNAHDATSGDFFVVLGSS
ncbi:MAG: hypothetical protein KF865_06480 [Bdellovibrionaceae bacterium]|nr:hypothetical protein [Pseudobdellovibrionaceae bacterium]